MRELWSNHRTNAKCNCKNLQLQKVSWDRPQVDTCSFSVCLFTDCPAGLQSTQITITAHARQPDSDKKDDELRPRFTPKPSGQNTQDQRSRENYTVSKFLSTAFFQPTSSRLHLLLLFRAWCEGMRKKESCPAMGALCRVFSEGFFFPFSVMFPSQW